MCVGGRGGATKNLLPTLEEGVPDFPLLYTLYETLQVHLLRPTQR